MNATGPSDRASMSYVHDDEQQREAFDHQLADFVRHHGEQWDLTAIVEPLELLGRRVRRVEVGLRRSPGGMLGVTLTFELPPHGAQS
jgi:hypothetical protein